MQVTSRAIIILLTVFLTALPALAERPRPLAWALDSARDGNWETAARIAARDGAVAADVIEWMRLRTGEADFADVAGFLARRPDWPGEPYLRRQAEPRVIEQDDATVVRFFDAVPPQSPEAILRYAEALSAARRGSEAEAVVLGAWLDIPMSPDQQARFLAAHGSFLAPYHDARLDAMLWRGAFGDARRLSGLASPAAVASAEARIALREDAPGVDTLIAAVPDTMRANGGLQYERFLWRLRKGRIDDAKDLLIETSTSVEALGRPEEWSNRRRSLARDEMRDGDTTRAYQLAARHFLTAGSAYADLEWLAGYIALAKLGQPETALRHFENLGAAVQSPISKGRAGYWRGRALEAMGNVAAADQAYADGAQHQTSFYGLLAAERAGLPFDSELAATRVAEDWRETPLASDPLFEAGLLLQASGELVLAERFWTHLAERLDARDGFLLGQAAVDTEQPHLAVMVGKQLAERGIVVPFAYYAMHPIATRDLPMAPEMTLAIARRESEFDPGVQSSAGARGLMQVMPATGTEVARRLGRGGEHSTARLISDPLYNAELGAEYLSMVAARFRGNVVMMSAAYNAGPSRPIAWIERFGDPRRGDIDIVDWIEHIPFRETRNYVMRVTESLPIYRAQLGRDPLPEPFSAELAGSSLLSFAPEGE
jgi:soluble lytic murein transglycosylase